jgi:hypothetical protein
VEQRSVELANTFADIARALLAEDDVEATLNKKITALAVEMIDACDHAPVSLVQGRRVSTRAAIDDVPVQVDAILYETDQGPAPSAVFATHAAVALASVQGP